MKDISPRLLSRLVWHQTRPRNSLLDLAHPARYDARYNRAGGDGAWYASFTERRAWAELFRHWDQDEISPFEVRRRVGRGRVADLHVLDLTDPEIRRRLGVEVGELTGNDWTRCQDLAEEAQAEGLRGDPGPVGRTAG